MIQVEPKPSLRAKQGIRKNLGALQPRDCFAAALLAMTKTVQPYGIMFKAVLRAFSERATTSLTSPCAARRQPKAIYCAEFRNVPKFLGAVRLWAASGDSRDVPVSGGDLHA
jgi:hypothetical protein